jgi:NAD(P)-dependent dehydrogenase (short-subunit alcohol dehydrogenase family)
MKVAVISGAAQGIGRRTAEVLRERGFVLALIDLRETAETLAALNSRDVDVLGFAADITSEDAVAEFAGAVDSRWGRVDVLVNNAGISCIAPSEMIAVKDYRRVLEVNLVAPFLLAQTFGKKMLAAGRGSIINIASVAGLLGVADRAAYNASKHGLIGLTRTLAAEWGGWGVRVNAVLPRLGKNRNGRCGSGRRCLHRCRHHRSSSDGAFRFTGRHCPRGCVPCRR